MPCKVNQGSVQSCLKNSQILGSRDDILLFLYQALGGLVVSWPCRVLLAIAC